jgi:formylglycine-generating enzyme required for sulfatase activity
MYHLVTVQPLSPDQVDRLAELWCKAIYPELDAPDEAASLQEEIRKLERHRADRGDDRLVDTPLLVAIVAIVHYNNHELPEKRAVLYDQCISALLAEKYKAPSEAGNRLAILGGSETEKRNTLALLAYRMMSAGRDAGRIVSESQLVDWLQPYFVRRYTEAKSEAQLAEFLDSMAGRASLLDERDRYYQFIHLTFQEYLAASYLNDTVRVLDEIIDFLAAENRLAESWWRETILLTAGYMALRSPDPALAFLQKLATLPANGELALAATELAGAGFLDQESLDESTSRLIADRLVSLLADSDLRAPNQLRGLAGVALGRLGDPRPDVACSVPDMVTISGGPFRMGSDKAKDSPYYDDLAYDDEVPNHEIVLPDYRIGRYPVTVAQYRVFVDEAKGYDHETFWTPTGWGWRQANKITQPRLWDDPQWTVDNHPVVSVSWHEAVAYCAWLRAETGRPFRLPDEAMWEKAARGTDARRWPWGSTWAATRLNAEGTIGRTSAVGIFPAGQSPYHICDAAGNVLEWCSGPGYRSGATYTNGFVRRAYAEDLALDADTRAVRGGSWLNNNQHTRAAFRDYDLPYDRDYGVGFRVAEYLSDPES